MISQATLRSAGPALIVRRTRVSALFSADSSTMNTDAYGLRFNMRRCRHPLECVLVLSHGLCTVCLARVFLGIIQRLVVPIESTVQMFSCGCGETDHTYRSRF